jgi:hypothetical protein
MTHGLRIKLRLWTLCAALMTCLPACQPTSEKVVAPPPPQTNELARVICETWARSSPTWAGEDTEETKDQIDYAIRSRKAVCSA